MRQTKMKRIQIKITFLLISQICFENSQKDQKNYTWGLWRKVSLLLTQPPAERPSHFPWYNPSLYVLWMVNIEVLTNIHTVTVVKYEQKSSNDILIIERRKLFCQEILLFNYDIYYKPDLILNGANATEKKRKKKKILTRIHHRFQLWHQFCLCLSVKVYSIPLSCKNNENWLRYTIYIDCKKKKRSPFTLKEGILAGMMA